MCSNILTKHCLGISDPDCKTPALIDCFWLRIDTRLDNLPSKRSEAYQNCRMDLSSIQSHCICCTSLDHGKRSA